MQVTPQDTASMLKHKDPPRLTLVRCRGYEAASNSYKSHLLVRAVRVAIK